MEQRFFYLSQQKQFFKTAQRILIAVSGGVDSIVLLDLMRKGQRLYGYELGVAHMNHQLRPESEIEAAYLRDFCQKNHIVFFETRWETPQTKGMEAAARTYRYQFFSRIMKEENYDILVTAHHGDDQIETVLMKILRGGGIHTYGGIKESRAFSSGTLVRPLLPFSKEDIYTYAEKNQLIYFEDATNKLRENQRNRLRIDVVPELKKENYQALKHIADFSKELTYASQIIYRQMDDLLEKELKKKENQWCLSFQWFAQLEKDTQYFLIARLFEQLSEETGIHLGKKQLEAILQQVHLENNPQWSLDLENCWQVRREYESLYVAKRKESLPRKKEEKKRIHVGKSLYLSEDQWLCLYEPNMQIDVPDETAGWKVIKKDLWIDSATILYARRRRSGDRIRLSEGLTKKVGRYFIDKKIPQTEREDVWIISDRDENIYGLLPFAFSYLSITPETDKIHYILLYKYQEKQLEGEPDVRKRY